MKILVLTNGFPNGFILDFNNALIKHIDKKDQFTLIASDFENSYEKTDRCCG